jgi:hypothetical protein
MERRMQHFEQLGVFYLGKEFDLEARKPREELLLYDSKDLTTHAVCVGMTGSGKTGLCLSMLEEAAIDGIPVIAIDPKGDLGNLLLTFPELRREDFQPWVDPEEARRKNLTVEELAAKTADTWRSGLEAWEQSPDRIAKFRDSVDLAIYTPGSNSGLPLAVIKSFVAPSPAIREDSEALGDRVASAVSGLLSLLEIDADPLNSREHILISTVLTTAWRSGLSLDLPGLLRSIQSPTFKQVGVVDLETFLPQKDRFALAMKLNNLLASPGFAAWMQGEPLDVSRLLYTPAGKPRISIISIAHLSDSERMFFVTLLLSEVLSWVRSQPGTSSLRAILYMDEVFGYFPPTANPPSKKPMLTLLKQARAYGLGIVLATQNPVDLDYKGLSNTGTWFLGRLQTERDKARVIEGLEGASAAAGAAFDKQRLETTLSQLGERVFLMNNVHDDHPVVFQTRWALSYLRGPLTRGQIQALMADKRGPAQEEAPTGQQAGSPDGPIEMPTGTVRPVVPPGIAEVFLPWRGIGNGSAIVYEPALLGQARIHFADAKAGLDVWEDLTAIASAADADNDVWSKAELTATVEVELENEPAAGARFAPLPAPLAQPKNYAAWDKALKDYLYRTHTLTLLKCAALKAASLAGESERDFRIRLGQTSREQRDEQIEKLRDKYAAKVATLSDRIRKAEQRVEREQAQASQHSVQAAITIGTSLLGALWGRKTLSATNVNRAGTAARAAGRAYQQRGDIGQASENVGALQSKLAELEARLQEEIEEITRATAPDALEITEIALKPKKADITVERVVLAWKPN